MNEKVIVEYWKKELNQYEYTKDLDLASDNYFGQFEEKINMISEILNLLEQKDNKINKVIDKLKDDKMEQFDDYIIYLIESYLEILEE